MSIIVIEGYPLPQNRIIFEVSTDEASIPTTVFNTFFNLNAGTLGPVIGNVIMEIRGHDNNIPENLCRERIIKRIYVECSTNKGARDLLIGSLSVPLQRNSALITHIIQTITRKVKSYLVNDADLKRPSWMTPPSKRKEPYYETEPSNTEEKIVNTIELATLLATTRLTEQGLSVEKEKEKFNRFLNGYANLIDKCVTTKNDDTPTNKQEEESPQKEDSDYPTQGRVDMFGMADPIVDTSKGLYTQLSSSSRNWRPAYTSNSYGVYMGPTEPKSYQPDTKENE